MPWDFAAPSPQGSSSLPLPDLDVAAPRGAEHSPVGSDGAGPHALRGCDRVGREPRGQVDDLDELRPVALEGLISVEDQMSAVWAERGASRHRPPAVARPSPFDLPELDQVAAP